MGFFFLAPIPVETQFPKGGGIWLKKMVSED